RVLFRSARPCRTTRGDVTVDHPPVGVASRALRGQL
ncbi:MAG: hypothetical protein AVDCRST_MAG88-2509, partial [uncultured Thermomicrobiales bacterium]